MSKFLNEFNIFSIKARSYCSQRTVFALHCASLRLSLNCVRIMKAFLLFEIQLQNNNSRFKKRAADLSFHLERQRCRGRYRFVC